MKTLFASIIILLAAGCASADNVSLSWDASCSPNIVGYNIYYGAGTNAVPTTNLVLTCEYGYGGTRWETNLSLGSYTNKLSVGNVTNATITGLQRGQTYRFAATATDTLGLESDLSNETSYTVPLKPGNPQKMRASK